MQKNIIIHRIVVGSFQVNCYLVACRQTKEAVIIDPGGEAERIVRAIHDDGLKPRYILNTHGHADHVVANRRLSNVFSVPVCMHEADDVFFGDPGNRDLAEKELGLPAAPPADKLLVDRERLQVGKLLIEVIHTPGHTPGSVCYLVAGNLFTGDTLFVGDVGRSDLVGGSFATLLLSIKEKILPLPDTTKVWPGHDYGESPTSTLAWEKAENPYITDFILAEE